MKAGWLAGMLVAVAGFAGVASAADPLAVAPDMYKLDFENERVRVMTVTFAPGQAMPEHSHPDHFAYVLETGTLKISHPDGTSMEASPKVGEVMWLPAETHSAVNIGTTQVRLLVVELK